MKKLKAILAVVFAAALLLTCALPAAADSLPMFEVSIVEAAPGDTVDVFISVKDNPGIASIKLLVEYHPSLTLNRVSYNTAIGGMTQQPQQLDSPVTLNWLSPMEEVGGDWVFATLNFTVGADAVVNCPITVTYEPDNVYNMAEENVTFAVKNGAVSLPDVPVPTADPNAGAVAAATPLPTVPPASATDAPLLILPSQGDAGSGPRPTYYPAPTGVPTAAPGSASVPSGDDAQQTEDPRSKLPSPMVFTIGSTIITTGAVLLAYKRKK